MSTEARKLALKNTLSEIKNVCSDVTNNLIFRENGEILVEDGNITKDTVKSAQETFHALNERATTVGGIESVTFKGTKSMVCVMRFEDLYVTTISSSGADEKAISNLTRVMIPTTLKMVQNVYPTIKNGPQEVPSKPELKARQPEVLVNEVSASEFSVETLTIFGGFMVDPDTVYVDRALIVEWTEKYGEKPIEKISLEAASTGRTVQCKFRPFRDTKYENRRLVQLPEKIQTILHIQKGAKVLIRPVFEDAGDSGAVSAIEIKKIDGSNDKSKHSFSEGSKNRQDTTVIQVMVEDLGGISKLTGPDSARVDNAVIGRWNEMFGVSEIKEVNIEERFSGKKIRCKLQAIKDSHFEGKGVIQLPEKIQKALETKKGALVLIKPILEKEEEDVIYA